MSSFNSYQVAAYTHAVYKDDLYPVLGLTEEAGEVAALYAKQLRKYGDYKNLSSRALMDELGDVLWMVAAIASDNGMSLQRIADHNLEKLQARSEKKELDTVDRG